MRRILTIYGRRQTADSQRAFTLIEMLAALALAMILLYMLFQIFATTGRAMTISNARSEIHANARAILRIMHQEISGAFLDSSQDADDDDNDGYPSSTTDPDDEVGNYFVIVDGTPGDRALFLSSSAIGMNSSLSEVAYWLDSSDPNKPILRRNMELLGFDTGIVTGSGSDTLSDNTKAGEWDTDEWANRIVIAAGQTRRVLSNTPTQLTVDPAWDPQPAVDEGYAVTAVDSYDATYATTLGENILGFNVEFSDGNFDTGTISIPPGADTLTDGDKSWSIDEWVGKNVVAGGQRRSVLSNTSDTLTVAPVWNPQPAVGERYTIEEFIDDSYIAAEKRLTTAVRITLRVRDRRGRLSEGEEFVEIIHIKGKE